jgi:hypothetical protein
LQLLQGPDLQQTPCQPGVGCRHLAQQQERNCCGLRAIAQAQEACMRMQRRNTWHAEVCCAVLHASTLGVVGTCWGAEALAQFILTYQAPEHSPVLQGKQTVRVSSFAGGSMCAAAQLR